ERALEQTSDRFGDVAQDLLRARRSGERLGEPGEALVPLGFELPAPQELLLRLRGSAGSPKAGVEGRCKHRAEAKQAPRRPVACAGFVHQQCPAPTTD